MMAELIAELRERGFGVPQRVYELICEIDFQQVDPS